MTLVARANYLAQRQRASLKRKSFKAQVCYERASHWLTKLREHPDSGPFLEKLHEIL